MHETHHLPAQLLANYDMATVEDRIRKIWVASGLANPEECIRQGFTAADAKPFCIVLPPPNVTGTLHFGHALMLAIEDIVVRYKRMKGYRTLWLPWTDHAAIATQSKVEKELIKKEGTNRFQLGREAFLARVETFAHESHDTIVEQINSFGASVDWTREAFTLDEKRNLAVHTAFQKMYEEGLIYRGDRIVNWDPKGQTTISDDEKVYREETVKFYHFQYGPFVIGTARPETKFGDKYVVMHPEDPRYAQYKHGQKFTAEWINGPIEATIIKDDSIDMAFGTGVMTITPWHSHEDFAMAEKHDLEKEQIIDQYGKLLPIAGEFAGKKINEARPLIVEKLRAKGLVVKEETYTHNIALAERTEFPIEPQIMKQWFIDVNKPILSRGGKTLKELMLDAVTSGRVEIIPERFRETYFQWINNLRDWCISRQIWYGHRIPVWYRGEEVFCGAEAPAGEGWEQDPDTLDTWFSSGLWTFSTLGWPEKTPDLMTYHRTQLLETGHDILFFWVARMILMTEYLLGVEPFEKVYLHGIITNPDGSKMSKSNGAKDPREVTQVYGNDALRMMLVTGVGPGNPQKYDENKLKAYRNFNNKIWNITRFILQWIGEETEQTLQNATILPQDQAYLNDQATFLDEIESDMDTMKVSYASEKLYHKIWHDFADRVIEEVKPRVNPQFGTANNEEKRSAYRMLLTLWNNYLRALHPFMPLITEELWSMMPVEKRGLLMVEKWRK